MPRIPDQVQAAALVVVVLCGVALVVARLRQRTADHTQGRLLPPLPLADQRRIVALAAGRPREALRLIRARLDVSLVEARALLDNLLAGTSLPSSWEQVAAILDPGVRTEVTRAAAEGGRVEAVRVLRASVRVRLTDAVRLVDAISAADPSSGPGRTHGEDAVET